MPQVTNLLWCLEDTFAHCSATILPPVPARGPTYSCAGEPSEGGYAEDLRVWLEHPTNPSHTLDITEWLSHVEQNAILDDIYEVWNNDRADADAYAEDLAIERRREQLGTET